MLRGDEAAVRSWLEKGGRANTVREKDGEVIGDTLLMDAAGQGHRTLVAAQAFAGEVECGQRRRAGGIERNARAVEIE